jgi:glycosyltransferase involved in cell wall biosynthesis
LIIPFLKKADQIFPVSRYTKEQCINRNLPAKKLSVITNGLDFSQRISITDKDKQTIHSKLKVDLVNKKILLTLGRLIPRKGHSWFIENVFIKLPKNMVYLIAGDGPEYPHILSIVDNLEVNDRVSLLGYVSEVEKAYLFQLADLFIMPNITDENDQEGFGIVLLEAGSYSLPVVASNIEGIKDAVIDGISGKLVEEKNAHDFINTILNMDLDRNLISEKLRQKYDWQIISRKYYYEFIRLTQSGTS